MTLQLFLALLTFAAISAWTPGPNNTLLMASGLAHGYRKTLPLVLGVSIGFPLMIAVVGLGLGEVFNRVPMIYTIMKYAGAAYMLWLAYKIATSVPKSDGEAEAKPLSFLQMALFQWINPKAWIMAMTALSAYTVQASYNSDVALVVLAFFITGIGSSNTWALFGSGLRQILSDPRWFRIINIGLALALVASIIPMLRH